MRLILDTQCFLSALSGFYHHRDTLLADIWCAFRHGELTIVFSEDFLREIERVLDYQSVQHLNIRAGNSFAGSGLLFQMGEYHAPVPRLTWPSLSDPDDWYLLDLLYHSKADALVTRDTQILKAGQQLNLPVYSPAEFSL